MCKNFEVVEETSPPTPLLGKERGVRKTLQQL